MAAVGNGTIDSATASEILQLLREKRVGGNFWGSRPSLPDGRDLLLAPRSRQQAIAIVEAASTEGLLDRCVLVGFDRSSKLQFGVPQLQGSFDWWHMASAAREVWADADHELALVAALAERPVRIFGKGRYEKIAHHDGLVCSVQKVIGGLTFHHPFGGDRISPVHAIELLSDWRRLIDRNRKISAFFGIAGWKRPTVDPMLWDGTERSRYSTDVSTKRPDGTQFLAWKSRTSAKLLASLAKAGSPVAEIEDGFIRGHGLGANCVPPLSIVVDFSGIYFDPSQPSDLECILESAEMDEALIERAARLRQMIVEAGISKYGGGSPTYVKSGGRRRVLVVGQVEDDRSILSGAKGQTNLSLLARARAIEPDAWLIYRPHPDVEAGHRKGHIPNPAVLRIANEIDRGSSISELVESVDEVHCITSQTGFEALIRGKAVTTHGVPFYAGWGLTTDLGPIPSRRSRGRSLDELVAATLILYPTYIDPVTRLPCPPEVLVGRITCGEDGIDAPLARLRTLQGKMKVAIRRLREAAA